MKVLLPLGIEPATSDAEGIEGTIGLLGCSCGLKVKIKDGFGTRPPTFLVARLSILVFLWHLSPVESAIWRGLRNSSNTYSFALRASPTPFAHVLMLIYFGVGSRGERP